ncbi:CBM35 domain-containing protein [Nonomuraea candida]|uniref:CBM35 domain-containing protein n=1 Tax=Nonomuraea candida TaxID=359159 RepID=UPI000A068684|nr:CBM35 domain-containing protein [Nonomuraea candida]
MSRIRMAALALATTVATVTATALPAAAGPNLTAASASLAVAGAGAAAGATLTVDVARPFRPVTHAASGGLYGLAENSRPADSTLLPIKVNSLTQPAPGVGQRPNGQPPGGDSLLVAPQADRVGAGQFIRMPDIYPDFPYRWVSWNDWLAKVDTMVRARLAATSVTNVLGWELWNEPDYTWNTAAAGPFNDGWVRTYRAVRALDPLTPIVGPSTATYDRSWMQSFLTHARNTGTLPDIICWHELQNPARIAADLADYRALEASLGISPRRISINEYAAPAEVDVPGRVADYVAELERGGVESAHRAFWYEYGTMNGLVTGNNQPTGTWWLYKWYGDMAGNMVTTTSTTRTGLDGFASYDGTRRIVDVVFGNEAGTNTVDLTGLGALGSSVRVTLSSTPSSGRFTAVPAPTTVSVTTRTVSGGRLTVQVPDMVATSAYRLVVEPVSGVPAYQQRYEAENASVFRAQRLTAAGASGGGYVGRIDNSGTPRTDSYVDFVVNVPSARAYTMTIGYANATGATATQGLAYNGGAWSTVSYPPTPAWGQFGATVSTTVTLKAGYNVIRLAKGSPHFAGGTGYAELDYIHLT